MRRFRFGTVFVLHGRFLPGWSLNSSVNQRLGFAGSFTGLKKKKERTMSVRCDDEDLLDSN